VFLDGQRLGIESGMAGFFFDVACDIAAALEMALPNFDCFAAQPMHYFQTLFLPQVLQALGQRRLLLLLDEIEELETRVLSGRLDEAVFAWLRHTLQHQSQFAFVFCGAHEPVQLTTQFWSPTLNTVLSRRVGHLSYESTRTLITQPTTPALCYDDLALDQLHRLVAGHPFFTQLYCHTLVDQANQQRRSFVLAEHVQQALPLVLELGHSQLADIWRNCSPDEQAILVDMASCEDRQTHTLSEREMDGSSNHKQSITEQHPLRALTDRELIGLKPGSAAKPVYVWRLGLLQVWLQLQAGTNLYPIPRSF
jgi:hypothetical protein